MTNGQLAQRVDSLEDYMKDLSYQALKTERELARLSLEMREFKDEMREFKDEMREFKDEMREFKDEMREFKDEMREFKDEMLTFKEEARQDRKESNRRWGELANKMGTLVEDIVAPSLPRVAKELFDCDEPEMFAVRMRRKKGPNIMELDAILVCSDIVLINETKSSLRSRDVDELVAKLETFDQYFPEYHNRKLMGVLASLYVDQSIINNANSQNVLVMGMGDEAMQVLNAGIVLTGG